MPTINLPGTPVFVRPRSRQFGEAIAASCFVLLVFLSGFRPVDAQNSNPEPSSHILLLVLDTVRADHMSIYGYERQTTPRLEEFVARNKNAFVYPLAFATSNWTMPSHASLFTGTLPSEHGIHGRSVWTREAEVKKFSLKAAETLPELLRDAGYRTGAIFANGWLYHDSGLRRGFDVWRQPPQGPEPKPHPTADSINAGIRIFFDGCIASPCFLFANYMDAHGPYIPPPPFAGIYPAGTTDHPASYYPNYTDDEQTLAYFAARYDEQIRALDARLGDLIEVLESRGILDNAWLIITSDHGESFGEHGVTLHGTSLYNEQVRIPLIIRPPPGVRLPEIHDAVSLVDITATLASLVSDRPLGGGQSLLDSTAPRQPAQMQSFGTWSTHQEMYGGTENEVRAIVDGKQKLIDFGSRAEIFDLTIDTAEQKDLIREVRRRDRRALLRLMPVQPDVPITPGKESALADLSEEQKEALRALGYLE